ncbi:MAG: DUF308 domain-containing protein [Olsenella sp.]|jgi:uncharacterized membrane protein HdeD (DUF308 family)
MDWKDKSRNVAKHVYRGGIVASILMVVLGVLITINPQASLVTLVWLMIAGFLIGGVYRIVTYGQMPYWLRPGYSLATGIMDVVCGILLALAAMNSPAYTYDVFVVMIGLMLAFELLFAGVNQLSSAGVVRRMGGSSGWAVAGGVLDLIAGILLLMTPGMGTLALMYILAFSLIVSGISVFSTSLDVKNRAKALGDYIDDMDEPFDPDNDPFFSWKRH